MEVILSGNANLYPPSGRFSFIAKTVELVGEGTLKKAYDELKRKLTTEGIFSPERKRTLPAFPQQIGIITSKTGAVIHDFANNVGKHGYSFKFIDSRVEGKEALFDLLQAIKTMSKQDIDILVIMRGGGSLQSLAAFDNESVVRAIASFPVPVIAAIGHHQDVPLTNLAADIEVSTPTAAANLVSRSWDMAERSLERDSQKILAKYQEALNDVALTLQVQKQSISEKFSNFLKIFQRANAKVQTYLARIQETVAFEDKRITYLFHRVSLSFKQSLKGTDTKIKNSYSYQEYFEHLIEKNYGLLKELTSRINLSPSLNQVTGKLSLLWNERITRVYGYALQNSNTSAYQDKIVSSYSHILENNSTSLAHCEKIINLNDPMRLLKHGYSLVKQAGVLVKQTKDVTIGSTIEVLVSDGTVISKVEATRLEERE
jgi:exodeoxyribonuclease VII large subunit